MGTWLKRYYRKIKIMSQTRILGLMVRLGILDLDFEQGFAFFTAQIEMVIVHFRSWVIFVPLVKTEDGLLLRLSTNRYVAVSYRGQDENFYYFVSADETAFAVYSQRPLGRIFLNQRENQ